MRVIAEYLWIDGIVPTPAIRGKPKIFEVEDGTTVDQLTDPKELSRIPSWGFDGSSTQQATGDKSDCFLKPVRVCVDPIRTMTMPNYLCILVLNEVMHFPGNDPHPSNTRAALRMLAQEMEKEEFWFGFEQELTLLRALTARPIGFPEEGFPANQGPYYCGVGADKIFGREIMEKHLHACLAAKLLLAGGNAEVMPGQWEWQIGNGTFASDPLRVADDLIISRYLIARIAEEYGVVASFAAKPEKNWNGAGMHTNFSTKEMRASDSCFGVVIDRLRLKHKEHIALYGDGIKDRLTGQHETCSYEQFRFGISDRGASIRIPAQVAVEHKGYLEDRRPCANADPYVVAAIIMKTIMGR